jgi:YbbR domain-containing protein
VESIAWTAPAAGTGSVAIYGVINGAAGDDQAAHNYYQVATPITITEAVSTGINALSDKLTGFNVYPTITNDNFNVTFDLIQSSNVTITLVSMQGQVVRTFANEESLNEGAFKRSFDVNGLATGVYLVRLQIGNSSVVSKIVKE